MDSGKLTDPDDKTDPVPVELSTNENLYFWLVVEILEFLILNIDILKKSSFPNADITFVIFVTFIMLLDTLQVKVLSC